MKTTFKVLITALLLASGSLMADVITIPVGQQSATDIALPQRGQSMDQVEQQHGAPKTRSTTGQPPITRWNYKQFSVYFEGKYVIHSVGHFSPKHPISGQ